MLADLLGATATGISWLWTSLSCGFVIMSPSVPGVPRAHGHRALGVQVGAARFVTAKAFHSALSWALGIFCNLFTELSSTLGSGCVISEERFLVSQVLNVFCVYICK